MRSRRPSPARLVRLFLPRLVRRTYGQADAIVAVSDGVADDLAAWSGLPRARIVTIYNPVVTDELIAGQREPVDHPWFQPGTPPVIMSAGRLGRAKDHPTLIRAFARVRRARPARLVIFGQGKSEAKTARSVAALQALAGELGVADDVALPGFVANPFAYMARAAVFALSSINEGLPGRADPGNGVRLPGGQHRLPERARRDPGGRPLRPAGAAWRRRGARGGDPRNPRRAAGGHVVTRARRLLLGRARSRAVRARHARRLCADSAREVAQPSRAAV